MPSNGQSSTELRAAVSVVQMAQMLDMSRGHFYSLTAKGVFLQPVYSVVSRKPFFTREMQIINLRVRAEQIGVNGDFVLFQTKRSPSERGVTTRPSRRKNNQSSAIVQGLRSLGLENVSAAAVERAMKACFPNGPAGNDEGSVLRSIFRHLRRQGTA